MVCVHVVGSVVRDMGGDKVQVKALVDDKVMSGWLGIVWNLPFTPLWVGSPPCYQHPAFPLVVRLWGKESFSLLYDYCGQSEIHSHSSLTFLTHFREGVQ